MVKLEIAGVTVDVLNNHKYIEWLTSEYRGEGEADFTVSATEDELNREREVNDFKTSDGYLESIVVYRKIAEKMPDYNAVVFHGAVLNYGGRAYLFTARSGVGKTTHTRLWLKVFGDKVHYLNGDKPVLRLVDGVPYAFGTPYKGKEGYGVNESAPLCGIVFVERGERNETFEVAPDDAVIKLVTQMYVPKKGIQALSALNIADVLVKKVPLVGLRCNMDDEAAYVAEAALRAAQK